MAHQIFRLPKATAISDNLTLVAGAKVSFFLTGTSTPTDTYQDSALTTPHTNPVIADAAGRFPPIYLNPDILYRVTFTDSADVDIYPAVDPVNDRVLSQAIIGGYLYPRTDAEIAALVTPTDKAFLPGNVRRYGAVGDGLTDDTTAIQNAINATGANGGDVVFPAGTYIIASSLDLSDRRSVRLVGVGSPPTSGSNSPSQIYVTATSGSRLIDCRSSVGIVFEDLMIVQSGAGFTGHVIDFDWSASNADAHFAAIQRCYFQALTTAASILHLHRTHSMLIEGNNFVGGACALLGGQSNYANRINVFHNSFIDSLGAPIKDPTGSAGQVWLVTGNTFEPLSGGGAGAVVATGRVSGLVFSGNWCGDASASGNWLEAAAWDFCTIYGNIISSGSQGLTVTGAFNNTGNAIYGNAFAQLSTAVNVTSASSWNGIYENNLYDTVTTRLSGSFTTGRTQTVDQTNHFGAQMFSNGVANGVGGTLSGVIWTILTGNSANNGLVVKYVAGQVAYPVEIRDESDVAQIAMSNHIRFTERVDLSDTAANTAGLYARDNGAGKTQIVAKFQSGAVQVIATEP